MNCLTVVEEHRHRDRLRYVGLAAPFADALLVPLHGEGGHRHHRNRLELIVLFQPLGHFEPRDLRQLNIHEDEVGPVLAGKRKRLHAVPCLQGLIAVRVEQIMKELHVQLVVLDDQNGFGHRLRLRRFGRSMMGDLDPLRHGAESCPILPQHQSRSPSAGAGFHRKTCNQMLSETRKDGGNWRFSGRASSAIAAAVGSRHSAAFKYSSEVSVPCTEKSP